MRNDTELSLNKFNVKTIGNVNNIEALESKISIDETIIYIAPSNITYGKQIIVGAIAFSDKAVYILNMQDRNSVVRILHNDILKVEHKADGLTGAKFTIYLTDGNIYRFSAGYKKDLAEELQQNIDKIRNGVLPNDVSAYATKKEITNFRRVGLWLFVDDRNKKWRYYPNISLTGKPKGEPMEFTFGNVVSCEIEEDGAVQTSIKKKGLGRAVVGGILFGGAGAIVGATTGSSKIIEKPIINSLNLKVDLVDVMMPRVVIPVIRTKTSIHSSTYILLRKYAEDMAKEFQKMIEDTGTIDNEPTYHQASSTADELRKYKELFDDGIITQEEFNAKKKQLLEQ